MKAVLTAVLANLAFSRIVMPIRKDNSFDAQLNAESDALKKRDIIAAESVANHSAVFFSFFVELGVGTPEPQLFYTIPDTGSFITWIRSNNCYECDGLVQFDKNKSKTYKDLKKQGPFMQYVDGTNVVGPLMKDVVSFDDIILMNTTIMQAENMTDWTMDALIGLGRIGSNFLNDLEKSGLLTQNLFSYWIADDVESGELILGGIDYGHIAGDISWFDVDNEFDHWILTADLFYLFDMFGDSTNFTLGNGNIAFDTGSSLASLSLKDADTLNTLLGFSVAENGSATGVSLYTIDCIYLPFLPVLSFEVQGILIDITSYEYVTQYFYSEFESVCFSNFRGTDALPNYITAIFGNIILMRWYTIFDFENSKLGLAEKNGSWNSTRQWDPQPTVTFAPQVVKTTLAALRGQAITTSTETTSTKTASTGTLNRKVTATPARSSLPSLAADLPPIGVTSGSRKLDSAWIIVIAMLLLSI